MNKYLSASGHLLFGAKSQPGGRYTTANRPRGACQQRPGIAPLDLPLPRVPACLSLLPPPGFHSLSSSARFQGLAWTWEGFIRVFWVLLLLDFFREIWAATHWPHLARIHPFHVEGWTSATDKKVLAPWYGPCAQIAPENFLLFPPNSLECSVNLWAMAYRQGSDPATLQSCIWVDLYSWKLNWRGLELELTSLFVSCSDVLNTELTH